MSEPATWVLLRGLMRDGRHWGAFPDRLRAAWPAARVELIDFPGNGSRHREASAASVPAMTEDCRAELRRRGLAPPYHLLAISLGAMVGADWATRQPQELTAAVLINTSLRPFCPPHWRLRPRAWPALARLLLGRPDACEVESRILALTSRTAGERNSLIEVWTRWRLEQPVSAANALRQLAAASRYRAPHAPPPVPLLVLCSAGDQLVDHRCSLRLAEAWGSALAVHPRAGHDLPLDDGGWVVEQIDRWLPR